MYETILNNYAGMQIMINDSIIEFDVDYETSGENIPADWNNEKEEIEVTGTYTYMKKYHSETEEAQTVTESDLDAVYIAIEDNIVKYYETITDRD